MDRRETTFTATWQYEGQPTSTVTVTTNAESMSSVVESFEGFLRACGFVFGRLEVVDE